MWLCGEHQRDSRITVLSSETVTTTHHHVIEPDKESSLLAALRLHEENNFALVKPLMAVWGDMPKPKPRKK